MDHTQAKLDGRGGIGGYVGRVHDVVATEEVNALTLDLKLLSMLALGIASSLSREWNGSGYWLALSR